MALSDYVTKRNEEEYKLSEETAREAVRELIDFYEIEFDEDAEEKALKNTEKFLDKIAEFYRLGLLENKRDDTLGFCVVQRLKSGQVLTYRELKGDDPAVADKLPRDAAHERAWALMGRLCSLGADAVKKLKGRDKQAMLGMAEVFTWA